MTRNWLLILGLDFDPAPDDEELLKQAIASGRDELAMKGAGDDESAAAFRELVEAIDAGEAEDALLDWTERIDQEKDARKLVYGSINEAIEKAYLADPSMGEAAVVTIITDATAAISSEAGAPAYELPAVLVTERVERLKERYGDQLGATTIDESQVNAVYEKYLGGLNDKSKKFDGYARDLANLGASDLYDFLEKAGVRNARALSAAQLAASAAEIAKNPPKHLKDPASTVNLAHNATEVFGDAELASRYAGFLKAQTVDDLFRDVKNFCTQTGTIPRNLAVRTVQSIAASIDEPEDAPGLLMGFARRNNMTVSATYDDLLDALGDGNARKRVSVVIEEERDSLGKGAMRTLAAMPAKSKRAIAIAVAAVVAVVIDYFAISNIVGNVQAQQQAAQKHQAVVDSFNEGALSACIQEALENGEWPIAITDFDYAGHSDFAPTSVDALEKQVDGNDMTATFVATLESSHFRQTTDGVAHLTLGANGESWQLDSWDFGASEAHPTRGVTLHQGDVEYPDAEVAFDAQTETCTATYHADNASWYGGSTGRIVYHFTFDGGKWVLDATDGSVATAFNSEVLVGSYQVVNHTRDSDAHLNAFAIESVDSSTGAIVASYEIAPEENRTGTVNANRATQPVSGTIEGAIAGDGSITLETSTPVHVEISCHAGSDEGTLSSLRLFAYGAGSLSDVTLQKQ